MKNQPFLLFYFFLLCCSISLFSCTSKTQLSKVEENYLSQNPDITVGIYIYYPPFEFITENGQVNGILIEYFNKLESNIGHTFKKKYYTDWQLLIDDQKKNKIDVILEIQSTEERRKYLNFTKPVFIGRHIILTKNDSQNKKITDLYGKKVCVCEDYSIEEYIRNKHPDIIRVLKPDEIACINALFNNEVEAVIGIESAINYFITKEGFSNLTVQNAIAYKSELSFGISKGKPILTDIIKKGNNSITVKEKDEILNKWLYDLPQPFDKKAPYYKKLVSGLSVLFVLSFLLNLYLIMKLKAFKKK
ncbi:transporter substrate-binding domain-containing protein [Lacinutrix sp. Hel_I_90]|uniref:transporter substrate-binding domain-containing protein n=1 Tax=Lacinutrix sp. Hel_I_90 TaxID=1249999 RepID=UPI0005C8FE77|nr:transporter substrate-binding domain-containing protein [Lacinutrix sp. Hel_I_90]